MGLTALRPEFSKKMEKFVWADTWILQLITSGFCQCVHEVKFGHNCLQLIESRMLFISIHIYFFLLTKPLWYFLMYSLTQTMPVFSSNCVNIFGYIKRTTLDVKPKQCVTLLSHILLKIEDVCLYVYTNTNTTKIFTL